MQVHAAVLRDRAAPFALEHVELAAPEPGQVLVEIAGTGFCHTDVLPRQAGFLATPPLIAGHEGAGVVTEVGSSVGDIAVGDHVLLSFDSCGCCTNCALGNPAYCETFFQRNMTGKAQDGPGPVVDGAGHPVAARWFGQSSFASHVIAGTRNVVAVDHDLPLQLMGPLGCGIQTGAGSVLIALGVEAGSDVAVFGAGGVGLAAVMAARVAGAAMIVAVDLHDARLELAKELGATHVLRGGADDVAKQIRKLTRGGVQYALDTTGAPAVIATGIDALRPTGTIGLVGAGSRELVLAPSALATGKNVMGILEGDAVPHVFLPRLISLWRAGRFPFDKLIRTYPLSAINEAERDAASGVTIKPVLIPEGQ
ncbi:NAD(P)-dependent alcohol dehydrogenase [Saccharopolyspora mangrovi]|uniref:NAD(P)-dependent alcohol dehydrogenase n=1 Tax=Saccharopolyspora mangrovi TaxID=3082379 RepID=A0ABU6AIJ4_9PSEU|nr:NAD(P)-dependent alcohol dehydrogenase [Saccharopolyspora sp. S2-29]MEB3371345.1 NAD(P)-dependent alcohol dehydrogenase [Saccharopolyspora sp. S2-29]